MQTTQVINIAFPVILDIDALSTDLIYLLIAILVMGLVLRATWAMAKMGSASLSQNLMRFRVMAQFLLVGGVVVFVYLTR